MSDPFEINQIALDALLLVQVIESLKLPKGTRLVGTKAGTEVHRKDGVSYLVVPLAT